MDKTLKRELKRWYLNGARPKRHYAAAVCSENAEIRARLDQCTVDGQIGVVRSGMDCDCTQYYQEFTRTSWTTVAEYKRWYDQHQQCLDGPESMWFKRPEQVTPEYRSRDLALMAYEDGHPSTVHPVSYDELMPG